MPERGDAPRAEEVGGGEFPEVFPVRAVGSEAHGAVEEEAVGGFLDGPVREGRVIEDVLGGIRVA